MYRRERGAACAGRPVGVMGGRVGSSWVGPVRGTRAGGPFSRAGAAVGDVTGWSTPAAPCSSVTPRHSDTGDSSSTSSRGMRGERISVSVLLPCVVARPTLLSCNNSDLSAIRGLAACLSPPLTASSLGCRRAVRAPTCCCVRGVARSVPFETPTVAVRGLHTIHAVAVDEF